MSLRVVRPLVWVGLAGVAINAAVLLAAPVLRPEISLVHGALSQYAIGPWSWLQTVGFLALGVGSLCLAWALTLAGPASRWDLPAAIALVVAGLGCIGLAAFPMGVPSPMTPLGDLHQTAGTIAVAGHLTAMLGVVLAARDDQRWRSLVVPGAVLWLVALANALATQVELSVPELPIPFGIVMRLVTGPVLVWWAAMAVWMLRTAAKGEIGPGSREPIVRTGGPAAPSASLKAER
jgi:hypothetical protein